MKKTLKIFVVLFLLLIISIPICYLYSLYEFKNVKIKEIEVSSKDIPKEFDGMKIMFVADFYDDLVHLDNINITFHQSFVDDK